ncbi:transferase [Aspergillus carlsbadensis]|nr:transferase [Aspergillus carlsbadensis]
MTPPFKRVNMRLPFSNIGLLLGVVVFMAGYFRPSPRLPLDTHHAGPDVLEGQHDSPQPDPPFDKVIFVVIDALRSDFVYAEESGFRFTQELIHTGAALPFTALASPPTLTVSRIKAMAQGTGQSFLDAWLNVMHSPDATRLVGEDTWLARFKAARARGPGRPGGKMVYYGVDMWCLLYPEVWDRFETVESFFLPDFNEGDRNVTRRMASELDREDWKGLVLHYPGLDCAAHFAGAKSSIVQAKQAEMDEAVRQIYDALERRPSHKNTLFVLAGDHGMTNNGNHGGDTPEEMASALLFISPKFKSLDRPLPMPHHEDSEYFYYSVVDQVDIVPTLAALLGFSIPAGSLGVVIAELLGVFPDLAQQMSILMRNAQQMMRLLRTSHKAEVALDDGSCDGTYTNSSGRVRRVLCQLETLRYGETGDTEDAVQSIREACLEAQALLRVPRNNLHTPLLALGITLLLSVLALVSLREGFAKRTYRNPDGLLGILVALAHGVTMFSPQLVAEEHHFWYWASLLWLVYLGLTRSSRWKHIATVVFVGALHIAAQSFNPTGETPWLAGNYLHDVLNKHPVYIWVLAASAHAVAVPKLSSSISAATGLGRHVSTIFATIPCALTLLFKMSSAGASNPELLGFIPSWLKPILTETAGNLAIWTLWDILLASGIMLLVRRRMASKGGERALLISIVELINVYLRIQARPRSLILFLVFDIQVNFLESWISSTATTSASASTIATTVLLLSQSAFFATGRSNSLASLDMINGYNGITHTDSTTNMVLVAVQTVISNWIGPVWWSLAGLRVLQNLSAHRASTAKYPGGGSTSTSASKLFVDYATCQVFFSATSTLAIMLSVLWWRDDLVLWTVLAPRYVNLALWVGFQQVLVNGLLCRGLWYGVAM